MDTTNQTNSVTDGGVNATVQSNQHQENLRPDEGATPESKKSRRGRTVAFFLLIGFVVVAVAIYAISGGATTKRKADVKVSSDSTSSQKSKADDAQESQEQAIEAVKKEVSGSSTNQTPITQNQPQNDPMNPNNPIYGDSQQAANTNAGTENGGNNTSNNSATGNHVSNVPGSNSNGGVQTVSDVVSSSRNGQTSLYFFEKASYSQTRQTRNVSENSSVVDNSRVTQLPTSGVKNQPPVKPPFGTVLPIRLMGALFTLRNGGLTRLELTRPVSGDGWYLPRGTIFVGRIVGGSNDRAYVNLIGFIDTRSNSLVSVGGELLGIDGAQGLKGSRKQVGSKWKRALGEVLRSGVQLGSAYLGRNGGGTTVVNTAQTQMPGGEYNPNGEYVSVSAGSQGYIMVNDLPTVIEGVDASGNGYSDSGEMTDDEVIQLMTTGTPDEIRAALPRMNPKLRAVAE